MKINTLFLFVLFIIFSCTDKPDIDQIKLNVLQAEMKFRDMAVEKGVKEAFLHFASEDAVLYRNNKLIMGKSAIREYFENQTLKNVKLDWKPDFVEVARSGDLAYTYGNYTFKAIDIKGETISSEGIFHTVWKLESDGSWKYVWD